MKIAVVGSHGTGKTTICKDIQNELNFNYIPDSAREALKLNFIINENTPPETQFWILSKQIELERNTPTPWISDKSLYDNIVYSKFSINDREILSVIKKIVLANANYDLLFYCPIEFAMELDGVRPDNEHFRKTVDLKIIKLLNHLNIEYVKLTGDKNKRLNSALREIQNRS